MDGIMAPAHGARLARKRGEWRRALPRLFGWLAFGKDTDGGPWKRNRSIYNNLRKVKTANVLLKEVLQE
ncbi:hypothetical protein Taro_018040, partial [Colocasia esculenta]|nr:hypothetical protein [Colocasia esculenta]